MDTPLHERVIGSQLSCQSETVAQDRHQTPLFGQSLRQVLGQLSRSALNRPEVRVHHHDVTRCARDLGLLACGLECHAGFTSVMGLTGRVYRARLFRPGFSVRQSAW